MITRFIDFEGIHGSGKSASAWYLYRNLIDNGTNSKVFFEVDMTDPSENPCDFRFMTIMTEEQFNTLKENFKTEKSELEKRVRKIGDYILLYYPSFCDCNELLSELKKYQAYDGRFDYYQFKSLMLERFKHFVYEALQNDTVYVFESVIFQHIINELLRFTESTTDMIADLIKEITVILQPLNPVLFHLRADNLADQISKVSAERLSDNYDLYPDWIDWMVDYVKNSAYGKSNHVKGRGDLMQYFVKRGKIEEQAYDALEIQKHIVHVDRMDKDSQNQTVYKIVRDILSI